MVILGSKMPYLLNFGDHKNFLKNRLHQFYEILNPDLIKKQEKMTLQTDGRTDRAEFTGPSGRAGGPIIPNFNFLPLTKNRRIYMT